MRLDLDFRLFALCLLAGCSLLGGAGCGDDASGEPDSDAAVSGKDSGVDRPDAAADSDAATQAGDGGSGRGGAGAGAGGAGQAGTGPAGAGSPAAGSGGSGAGAGGAGDAGDSGTESTGTLCGTRGAGQCAASEFCDYADPECGATDKGGQCSERPGICNDIYLPICGCDNRTYSSECTAHGAGVSVKHAEQCTPDECDAAGGRAEYSDGASTPQCESGEASWSISGGREAVICCLPAKPRGKTCGGIAALMCNPGEFCDYEPSAGGQGCDGSVNDAGGTCQAQPQTCSSDYVPICGCDRRTYGNRCEANSMGESVMREGACTELDCTAIGGRASYGIGPAATCNADEREHGSLVNSDGSIPIEGALCCLPK